MTSPFRNQIVSQQSLSAAKQKSQSQPRSLSYILMERWGQQFGGMFIFSCYVYVSTITLNMTVLLIWYMIQSCLYILHHCTPSGPLSPTTSCCTPAALSLVHGSGRSIKIFFKWLILKFREQVGQSIVLIWLGFGFILHLIKYNNWLIITWEKLLNIN